MRFSRRIVGQLLVDLVVVNVSTMLAVVLLYGIHGHSLRPVLHSVLHYAFIVTVFRMFSLYIFRTYRIYWRYISFHDLQNIFYATSFSSLLLYIVSINTIIQSPPRMVQILDWGINIFAIGSARLLFRWLDWKWTRTTTSRRRLKTLIVGAGDAGETVARDLLRRSDSAYHPIGFVDDDPRKVNIRIHGLPILGKTSEIPEIVARFGIESILIATPSALGRQIRDLVTICEKTDAQLRIVPGVIEALQGSFTPAIRQVEIEDLLRRPPVRINLEEIASYISGQTVLVTGAGGSIGSELCRQIAPLNPKLLLLLGQGENSIFEIQQELTREFQLNSVGLVGSVQDIRLLNGMFDAYRPEVVFHAAAHKHVPLMEQNPCEAIKNNVQGTRNVAQVASEHGVAHFIYVSTDKAVNPVSVMGASKRAGEMVIQAMARHSRTKFVAVRFGNVLGSRGSVVPIMKRQIERGGPVTVTHPDMTRYFMTIPEAVQLIIQAGAMGQSGEIFILDMGEPVRIVDLARDLIKLSGFIPDHDIKIVFSGIRPGEKIFEELLTADERNLTTTHEKIFVAPSQPFDFHWLWNELDYLYELSCSGNINAVRDGLFKLVQCPHMISSADKLVPAGATIVQRNGTAVGEKSPVTATAAKGSENGAGSREPSLDNRTESGGQWTVDKPIPA
jgi:FlaA1/EpsC-like NDP-sugar epimerase